MESKTLLTTIIINKDGAQTLRKAIVSAKDLGDVILADDGSCDNSIEIGLAEEVKVIQIEGSFAIKRNKALKYVDTPWVFYLDADEVVSKTLKDHIHKILKDKLVGCYEIRRQNYFLKRLMYDDTVKRLFYRKHLVAWYGKVHETPRIIGTFKSLNDPIYHHTHNSITSMLSKTNEWSEIEADLRIEAKHPKMAGWRLLRIIATEMWRQVVSKKIYKYGREGLFEGYFQVIDKLIVYTKLYEKQLK